ncbi:MAG: OsmC family protein [Candidatus Sulfotelmatobacter sp.]
MSQPSGEQAYRVAAWWTSGRSGLAKSDSAPNAIHFAAPKEFGGLEGRWTPEELLLAALAGCFTTTLRAIAGSAEFDFTDFQLEASGTIRKSQFGYGFSEIVICPTLKITCSEERERALDLLKKAERLCLVSRAIDVPLRFESKIEVIEAELPGASMTDTRHLSG